jgi:secreted protein with Ig-like and vWFA domain
MPDSPNSDSSPDHLRLPQAPLPAWARWRRPVLLASGASLLAIGVFANRAASESPGLPPDARIVEDRLVEFVIESSPQTQSPGDLPVQRHRGEEGTMGKPTSKNKAGLYAMKGPKDAGDAAPANDGSRNAGILGVMQSQSGHFLASPHAAAVGNDDEDVWGGLEGTEVGEAFGVAGLGLTGTGRGGGGVGQGTIGLGSSGLIGKGGAAGTGAGYGRAAWRDDPAQARGYAQIQENAWTSTAKDPKSTFSIDVDTASYSSTRRFLREGQLPPPNAVRIEELVNYFSYDYAPPQGDVPFSVTAEVGPCPWNVEHRLVHVGLQGKMIANDDLPPRNLVFLVDVSGSMMSADRLPLVKRSLAFLVEHLSERDRVAMVVYAGAAGVVLPPTSGADKATILEAIQRLEAGGSTNGGAGIQRAYALAHASFIDGGINRVVVASDGDFNVGVTSRTELVRLIEREREGGVFLSVLGYGMGNFQDATMEQLADKGNGNYAYIDSLAEARKVLVEEAGATLVTIAKDVKIQVELDPATVERFRLVGYENRVLAHRDFDDDTKDAGEIGAGHTVTALYEVVPRSLRNTEPLMNVDVRYKQPQGDESDKLSFSITDTVPELADTTEDFRWSAAVAAFGMLLRDSSHRGDADWGSTRALAIDALGADPMCRRHEMIELVSAAARLSGTPLPALDLACTPGEREPSRTRPALDPMVDEALDPATPSRTDVESAPTSSDEPEDRDDFWLGVLRLLPPLLAFPLFILAWRDPYRRRRE